MLVVALIGVPVRKVFYPLPVLEAVFKLALVTITIDPGVNSVAISPALPPLPDVGISLGSSPDS